MLRLTDHNERMFKEVMASVEYWRRGDDRGETALDDCNSHKLLAILDHLRENGVSINTRIPEVEFSGQLRRGRSLAVRTAIRQNDNVDDVLGQLSHAAAHLQGMEHNCTHGGSLPCLICLERELLLKARRLILRFRYQARDTPVRVASVAPATEAVAAPEAVPGNVDTLEILAHAMMTMSWQDYHREMTALLTSDEELYRQVVATIQVGFDHLRENAVLRTTQRVLAYTPRWSTQQGTSLPMIDVEGIAGPTPTEPSLGEVMRRDTAIANFDDAVDHITALLSELDSDTVADEVASMSVTSPALAEIVRARLLTEDEAEDSEEEEIDRWQELADELEDEEEEDEEEEDEEEESELPHHALARIERDELDRIERIRADRAAVEELQRMAAAGVSPLTMEDVATDDPSLHQLVEEGLGVPIPAETEVLRRPEATVAVADGSPSPSPSSLAAQMVNLGLSASEAQERLIESLRLMNDGEMAAQMYAVASLYPDIHNAVRAAVGL
jgi:hypothetical protein